MKTILKNNERHPSTLNHASHQAFCLNYADLAKKFLRNFSDRCYKTLQSLLFSTPIKGPTNQSESNFFASTTSPLTLNMRDKQFADTFANGLRWGKFNVSLANKPAANMQEVLARVKVSMKGKESNAGK